MLRISDTIFALSTVFGKSGVAMFRISGSDAQSVIHILRVNKKVSPRNAVFTKFYDENGEIIDEGILTYFQAPESFTGEDVVELSLHGSIAVINAMSRCLSNHFRIAERGEFTRRAFLSGKFDLTSAEGIAELIDAKTPIQMRQALKQISGVSRRLYDEWRKKIVIAMAMLEGYIDFSDEDIPEHLLKEVEHSVKNLSESIGLYLDDGNIGQKIKDGVKITIVGPPNSGKSTLLNYFAKREAAIVSSIAGTTRDIIESSVTIDGFLVTFNDTAGLRDTCDEIEKEGIKRTNKAIEEADLVLVIIQCDEVNNNVISEFKTCVSGCSEVLYLASKCDLLCSIPDIDGFLSISVHKKIGLENLNTRISNFLRSYNISYDSPIITEQRHRKFLKETLDELNMFLAGDKSLEILAEHLRRAVFCLGSITGIVQVEEVLDVLFSKLCVGK